MFLILQRFREHMFCFLYVCEHVSFQVHVEAGGEHQVLSFTYHLPFEGRWGKQDISLA